MSLRKINDNKFLVTAVIVLVVSGGANFFSTGSIKEKIQTYSYKINGALVSSVSAQEIYPLFACPCCGRPLDPKDICCGMAQERITFIDQLTAKASTKEKVVMSYVKKYGLSSFIDKKQAKEFEKKLIANAPLDRPIITTRPESIDLGKVSQAKGVTTTLFKIANTGKTALVINKLETSCGCTTASIIYQNQEGPRFSMPGHGINEKIDKNWRVTIPAGKTAQLKVYYDPNVHKKLRGAVIREIHIFSNDPVNFEKKVQIELDQVD